ncbi:hypothetical protein SAMN02745166_00551 [Prosthecobacter debontii]|uniref:Uncharacterized protein n=1 Tax=Prosthecobacter debontii TaxID=48467 RepID=A0A1T4WR66_9BACT|nr:hypothetical protein [Prosthecobacter debontii]SKA79862.1 hypothetical protein SAMN02745166_00551 [Prosthecobacter debontii]
MRYGVCLRFLRLSLCIISLFLSWEVWGCPNCNVYNHLATAVYTADFVGIGSVATVSADQNSVTVRMKKGLRGKVTAAEGFTYENPLRHALAPGAEVAILGMNRSTGMTGAPMVLPDSLIPELHLLLAQAPAQNADEAARQMTAVSSLLHWQGVGYYKAFPDPVQQLLKEKVQSFRYDPASTSFHEQTQCLFGIAAIMRGPTAGAEEIGLQIMDEFWKLPETGMDPRQVQWALTRLTAVFDMITALNLPRLKEQAVSMIGSASGGQFLRLAQCLIVSRLMTPAEIAGMIRYAPNLALLKQATVLAALRFQSYWSRDEARDLAKAARALSPGQKDLVLDGLERELSGQPMALSFRRPSLEETPDGPGWAVESALYSNDFWNRIEPYRPVSLLWKLSLGVLGLGLLALTAWGFSRLKNRCRGRMEAIPA